MPLGGYYPDTHLHYDSRCRTDQESNTAPFLNQGFEKRRSKFGEKTYKVDKETGKKIETGFKYDKSGACFLNKLHLGGKKKKFCLIFAYLKNLNLDNLDRSVPGVELEFQLSKKNPRFYLLSNMYDKSRDPNALDPKKQNPALWRLLNISYVIRSLRLWAPHYR